MIRVKSKQMDNARREGHSLLIEGWLYQLQCTVCEFEGSVFSTFANLELLDPELLNRLIGLPHECKQVGDDDETTVTSMTQVFDEHLTATLPQTIIDQLENLPHLRRLGANNLQRLQAIMDLMRHPNNMLQLWVWTRMAWAFGKCNAEVAHLNFSAMIVELKTAYESQDLVRRHKAGDEFSQRMLAVLGADLEFPQWKEYNAFMSGLHEDDPHA